MAKTTQKSSVAIAYAGSLLELANEQNQAEQIGQELGQLREIIKGNRTFMLFLSDPSISHAERGETLKRILGSQISPLLRNFVGVLNLKNRLSSLSEIADTYDALLDEQMGKIEVEVTVASKLSSEQLEEVRKKVSQALKKDAIIHQNIDDSIIGGLMVRVHDKLIDASVKTQLATMKEQLLAARAK